MQVLNKEIADIITTAVSDFPQPEAKVIFEGAITTRGEALNKINQREVE